MTQDFSWDEQGFSVMSRFYADMSLLLDDKFRIAKHMTYNYLGDTRSVDTSPFRWAVWNYIQVRFFYLYLLGFAWLGVAWRGRAWPGLAWFVSALLIIAWLGWLRRD
jgi:hypothetical protein